MGSGPGACVAQGGRPEPGLQGIAVLLEWAEEEEEAERESASPARAAAQGLRHRLHVASGHMWEHRGRSS